MGRVSRSVIAVLVALTATLGVVGVVATPASAAWTSCPDHDVCLFDNGAGGLPILVTFSETAWGGSGICFNFSSSYNDKTGSIRNNFHGTGTTHQIAMYANAGCSSLMDVLPAGWSEDFGIPDQNVMSSIFFY